MLKNYGSTIHLLKDRNLEAAYQKKKRIQDEVVVSMSGLREGGFCGIKPLSELLKSQDRLRQTRFKTLKNTL